MNYEQLQSELDKLRASRIPTSDEEPSSVRNVDNFSQIPSSTKDACDDIKPQDLPWWYQALSGWRFQLAFTLLLWTSMMHVGFGAIFFLIACVYWLWVFGTDTRRRQHNPDTILAGWYFDNQKFW